MGHAGRCAGADNVVGKGGEHICKVQGKKSATLTLCPFPDSEFFRVRV